MIWAMADLSNEPTLVDPEVAAFLQGGVSIVVAGRTVDCVPDVVRGCGCRISRDRRRVTVLVDPIRARELLDQIRANRTIAVVFSQPSTHRTIQLKAVDAVVTRATPTDRRVAEAHLQAWIAELVAAGYGADLAAAIRGRPENGLVAIAFTPTSAFEQTPGPAAGRRLGASA
jgi:hypothetical protein